MDGLHSADARFSPGRAMSPQVRPPAGPPDIGRWAASLNWLPLFFHWSSNVHPRRPAPYGSPSSVQTKR
uniref:Uncharacterized protein n=2 Tax=Aegilops tauschii subsp. strangulata TaxID=200361 RepID=A0A453FRG6_AEGTS